jgi:alanine-synthesizing transaminase
VRLDFTQRENAISRALAARGEPYIDLTASNPTVAQLPIGPALLPAAPLYDPQPRGLFEAREAAASVHGVSPDRVLLCASTSEAYSWIFKLLCDPGDEVLVPQPCYPLFELLTALEGVRAVPYPLRWDGEWHLDASLLQVSKRTRAVLIVNPGNPTGAYLKRAEYEALARLGLPIVSDEVFSEFPWAPDPRRVATVATLEEAPAFALSGLSKSCGLPQLKLGWIAASGPGWEKRLAGLELIADTYLSVSTPVQLAAPSLLANRRVFQEALRERLTANLQTLRAARSAGASWDVLPGEGGWSAILRVPSMPSEEEQVLRILDAGALVHPGYFFDFPGGAHLVLSLLPEPGDFARGVEIVSSVLRSG